LIHPIFCSWDEPTTHLDIPSIDALAGALQQFEGTLIFISHDVYFIRALANHVVHVNAGKLTTYAGPYQYYLDKTAATSERAALTAGNNRTVVKPNVNERAGNQTREKKRHEAHQRQKRSHGRKEQQQVVHRIEKEIQDLEKRQAELTAELENRKPMNARHAMEINRELSAIVERLDIAECCLGAGGNQTGGAGYGAFFSSVLTRPRFRMLSVKCYLVV